MSSVSASSSLALLRDFLAVPRPPQCILLQCRRISFTFISPHTERIAMLNGRRQGQRTKERTSCCPFRRAAALGKAMEMSKGTEASRQDTGRESRRVVSLRRAAGHRHQAPGRPPGTGPLSRGVQACSMLPEAPRVHIVQRIQRWPSTVHDVLVTSQLGSLQVWFCF